ncbi:MAG: AMP-binding protein [Sphingomonadales bacterium]|nr:AMP-binding protein [Sphingomonadales bacterium]
MPVPKLLDAGAHRYPDNPCLVASSYQATYRQVQAMTHQVANALKAAGAAPGEHACVLSRNDPLAFIAMVGAMRAGLPYVVLNIRDTVEDLVEGVIDRDVKWLFFHTEFSAAAEALKRRAPGVKRMICLDAQTPACPSLEAFCGDFPGHGGDVPAAPEDVLVLASSGGTTGKPKGVMLTHRAMNAMIAAGLMLFRHKATPVHLAVAPITHAAAGIVYPLLPMGGKHILLPRADPGEILQTIEREKVTTIFLPPTLIYMLLAHPDIDKYDYSSLEYMTYAASPMAPVKLQEALTVFGPVMLQAYGQAEAPLMLTAMTPEEHVQAVANGALERLASCGRPTPSAELAIMDDDGRLLGDDERGEIVVRGDIVMSGYYGAADATAAAGKFGWHHTGDVGYRDADGFYYIVDRKRDMIISGGFNVYPSEVENALMTHPDVQDCAVIGAPDDKWGEAVVAVVERKPGAEAGPDELIGFCKERLGGMKAPKRVEVWDTLPRSAVGKVLKREIRSRFWQGQERSI